MSTERVTLRTIAEKAGVSLNTVSLALRNSPRLKAETRERVQRLAQELGYTPNPVLAAGMAQLTQRKSAEVGAVLMCIHFQEWREVLRWAGVRRILDGIKGRAGELGYRIEHSHLHDQDSLRRLLRLMKNRGVPGAIVVGASWREAEELLVPVVEGWPVIRAGRTLQSLPLHFSESDHFLGTRLAFNHARQRGARRIGMVVSRPFDRAQEGALSGAFGAGQYELPLKARIEPLLHDGDDTFEKTLLRWWKRWRPDAILTNEKKFELDQWRAWNPTDIDVDFIQLGRTEETPGWSGVTYPGENVGRAAVDMLVAQIHRGERGIPRFQKSQTSVGTWVDAAAGSGP